MVRVHCKGQMDLRYSSDLQLGEPGILDADTNNNGKLTCDEYVQWRGWNISNAIQRFDVLKTRQDEVVKMVKALQKTGFTAPPSILGTDKYFSHKLAVAMSGTGDNPVMGQDNGLGFRGTATGRGTESSAPSSIPMGYEVKRNSGHKPGPRTIKLGRNLSDVQEANYRVFKRVYDRRIQAAKTIIEYYVPDSRSSYGNLATICASLESKVVDPLKELKEMAGQKYVKGLLKVEDLRNLEGKVDSALEKVSLWKSSAFSDPLSEPKLHL